MCVVEYGQILIGLVKELKLPWLKIRLVGYMVGDEKGYMKKWFEIFKPGVSILISVPKNSPHCGSMLPQKRCKAYLRGILVQNHALSISPRLGGEDEEN